MFQRLYIYTGHLVFYLRHYGAKPSRLFKALVVLFPLLLPSKEMDHVWIQANLHRSQLLVWLPSKVDKWVLRFIPWSSHIPYGVGRQQYLEGQLLVFQSAVGLRGSFFSKYVEGAS